MWAPFMEQYTITPFRKSYKGMPTKTELTTTYTIVSAISTRKAYKMDFIPLIKCMPNICKWLGLGKMVRRNKRRVQG